MPVILNERRKFAADPAWRASKFIGHMLLLKERGTLKVTPKRTALYQAALETPGVSDRLIEQGKRCWMR